MMPLTPRVRAYLGLDEQPADEPLMPGVVPSTPYSPYDDGYASSAPIPPTAAPAPAAPPFPQPAPVAAPTLTYNDPTAPELYNGGGVMPSGGGTPDATNASPSSVAQPAPSPPVQNALNLLSDPGNTGTVHGPAVVPPTQAEAEEDARRALDASPQIRPPLTNPVYAARDAAVETARQVITPPESVEDAADRFIKSIFSLGLGAGPPAMIVQAAQQAGGDALGRAVARLLGLGNREVARLFGDSVTEEDVAGFAGSVVTDPTVYVGGGGAIRSGARGLRGALERGTEAATNLVGRTLVGGLGGAGVGLATGQDAETTGQMAAGGALAGAGAPLVRPVARVAGRALEPLGRELGEQMLARAPRMVPSGEGGAGRPIQMTVEVLRERMDMLRSLRERARAAGDAETEADANGLLRQYEDELIDAMNARLDLEPALESDVGRRIEATPRDARALDPLAPERIPNAEIPRTVDDAPRGGSLSLNGVLGGVPDDTSRALAQRTAPRAGQVDDILPDYDNPAVALADDIKWHRQHIEDFRKTLQDPTARPGAVEYARQWLPAYERELADMERRYAAMQPGAEDIPVQPIPSRPAGSAAAPSAPGRDILATVTRAVSEPLVGGFGGAVINQGMNPDDPDAARKGFLTGMVGFPLATRGARQLARRAGAQGAGEAGGALASVGATPGGGFDWSKFPGAKRVLDASAQRAARMAARPDGPQPLNPLQWTMEYAKSVGYSSMIGLRTATVNLVGNVGEPLWAGPKELTRAVLPTMVGGRGHPNEALAWLRGNLKGAQDIPGEALDALLARGHYMTNPDQPRLSERTVNPIAHAAALIPELGGRIFSGLPDAIFGSMARGAGEEMAAVRIANDAGLKGDALKQRVAQILADKDAILAGAPPADPARLADAQRVLRDGQSYSNDMTYRNDLGTIGEKLKGAATLGGAPVIGTTATPFFTTPHNMNLRMLERTPIGLGMNTVNRPGTMRTNFDRVYDATVGSAILAGLVLTVGQTGRITGSGPDDPEKRKMLEATGWRQYSVLVPGPDGKEYYIPSRYIGPYGKLLNAIGDYRDAQVYRKPGSEIGLDYVKRFGKLLQDDVYASGLTELVHLLDKPEQFLPGFLASQASRLTPYGASMRDIATANDPIERQPQSAEDAGFWGNIGQRWRASTGVGRQELDPKTDVRGDVVENESQGWRAFVPKASQASADPVLATLLDNRADLGKPRESFTFTAAGADAPDGGVGTAPVRLTPGERRDWQRYRWQVIEEQLYPAILANPEYQRAPKSVKERIWERQMGNASRAADGMLKAQIGAADLERRIQEAFVKLRAAS